MSSTPKYKLSGRHLGTTGNIVGVRGGYVNRDVFEFKRLTEEWSGMFVDGDVVALYHSCRGTKGACEMKSVVRKGNIPHFRFNPCDMCHTEVPNDILFIVKLNQTRIK